MNDRADALILPSDTPTSEVEVKKSLLFFDSVTLPNPVDSALVNEGEIVEKFPPNHTVTWTERNRFPRTPDYQEVMLRLISDTKEIQKKGLVRLTPAQPIQYLSSGMNWALWHSAITDVDLVEAAAPDRFVSKVPALDSASYMRGFALTLNGYTSKYHIQETRPAAMLTDADERWSIYAHLRIGRLLKFVRLSHGLNLIPLATDDPNQNMLAVTSGTEELFLEGENRHDEYADVPRLVLQLDIFDADALKKVLHDMSWREIIRLRKEILPGVQSLRAELKKATKLQGNVNPNDKMAHMKCLESLLKDYQDKREKLAEEWEKLRIAAVLKSGGAVGSVALADLSGLIAVTTGAPLIELLIKLFSAGLIGAAALSGEFQRLIPARRKVKNHSLYFIEKFPKNNK